MILYIHGFGSSGQGGKSNEFRDYFKAKNIPYIAPSLSYVPELAISTLEELIESCDDVTLIGSSLGGYYAMYLAEKYRLKAVLINPATHSAKTLERVVNLQGEAKNYYDNSTFSWQTSHLDMLRAYEVKHTDNGTYLLLVQKGDDVLDYKDAIAKVPHAQMVVEEGGTHPFEGISRHFEKIENFLK